MAKSKKTASEPALGYEAEPWQMADALRNNREIKNLAIRGVGIKLPRGSH